MRAKVERSKIRWMREKDEKILTKYKKLGVSRYLQGLMEDVNKDWTRLNKRDNQTGLQPVYCI